MGKKRLFCVFPPAAKCSVSVLEEDRGVACTRLKKLDAGAQRVRLSAAHSRASPKTRRRRLTNSSLSSPSTTDLSPLPSFGILHKRRDTLHELCKICATFAKARTYYSRPPAARSLPSKWAASCDAHTRRTLRQIVLRGLAKGVDMRCDDIHAG